MSIRMGANTYDLDLISKFAAPVMDIVHVSSQERVPSMYPEIYMPTFLRWSQDTSSITNVIIIAGSSWNIVPITTPIDN